MKCEIILKNEEKCGKPAKYKVRHKAHSEKDSFFVCEEHIEAYKYIIEAYKYIHMKDYGATEGSFEVEEIKNDK